jgi:hypothetical protein
MRSIVSSKGGGGGGENDNDNNGGGSSGGDDDMKTIICNESEHKLKESITIYKVVQI